MYFVKKRCKEEGLFHYFQRISILLGGIEPTEDSSLEERKEYQQLYQENERRLEALMASSWYKKEKLKKKITNTILLTVVCVCAILFGRSCLP